VIRPARPTDAEAIAAIWNPIIDETTITFTTIEVTEGAVATLIARAPVRVAEIGGAVSGFVTWAPFRPGPGYADTLEHSIYLAPAARGQGVGRRLMQACLAEAGALGGHSMIAGIGGENAGGLAFHRALGFETVARLPGVGRKFGRRLDLVLMRKFL